MSRSIESTTARANDAAAAARAGKSARQLGQYSGCEGRERELGVAAALRSLQPNGARPGGAMTQVIRTMTHNQGDQHEMNDALVKMTLDHIMFTRRHGMLKQLIEDDILSQRQQLKRVRGLIDRRGSRDRALVAIFEQTACILQLVDRHQRAPGTVTFKSPYGTVLRETVRLKIHDLTEQEIHEIWTIPRMQAYAQVVGVDLEFTPWREDGIIRAGTARLRAEPLELWRARVKIACH